MGKFLGGVCLLSVLCLSLPSPQAVTVPVTATDMERQLFVVTMANSTAYQVATGPFMDPDGYLIAGKQLIELSNCPVGIDSLSNPSGCRAG